MESKAWSDQESDDNESKDTDRSSERRPPVLPLGTIYEREGSPAPEPVEREHERTEPEVAQSIVPGIPELSLGVPQEQATPAASEQFQFQLPSTEAVIENTEDDTDDDEESEDEAASEPKSVKAPLPVAVEESPAAPQASFGEDIEQAVQATPVVEQTAQPDDYEPTPVPVAETPVEIPSATAPVEAQAYYPPELQFCEEHGIKATRRDEFLNKLLEDKNFKLVAIAGTHGKTTTTAMTMWLFKQLGIPESHSVAAKSSFCDMGEYDPDSEYFIYEADEYDQNFLAFYPHISLITGIDWDHPDVFPTREDYVAAFRKFLDQSREAIIWDADMDRLGLTPNEKFQQIYEADPAINEKLHLPGLVNRQNAWEVAHAVAKLTGKSIEELLPHLDKFPGVGRRFEQIAPHIYSDYAHTPPKIRGALQLAHEVAGDNVIVVYEGLHNTRQHFIKDELRTLFDSAKTLYIVPSYLAREDKNLKLLSPEDLKQLLNEPTRARTETAELNDELKQTIQKHADAGELVLCLTAGGGNSLDEWLRKEFAA